MKSTKASKRLQKRIHRAITKAVKAIAIETARERAARASKVPPPEFQRWGVVKTRAWMLAAKVAAQQARLIRPSLPKLIAAADTIESVPSWDVDRCADFLQNA